MPSVGAGNCAIAFGDFGAGYLIVDRQGMKFLRDPYSDKPHVHVYCYRRTGGNVALTDAIKLLKVGTA
jgi:HK97 family phage major capsid protein